MKERLERLGEPEGSECEARFAAGDLPDGHPGGQVGSSRFDGVDVVLGNRVGSRIFTGQHVEERLERRAADQDQRLRSDVVHTHVGSPWREEEQALDQGGDRRGVAKLAELVRREAVDQEVLTLVLLGRDVGQDFRGALVLEGAERADHFDTHLVVFGSRAGDALERTSECLNHVRTLRGRNVHGGDRLGRADRVILRHLGAPVQRFDERRQATCVLHLVQQIEDGETIDPILGIVEIGFGQRPDDHVGDGSNRLAGSVASVGRERFRVDLFEVVDRVFTANRVGELPCLSLRIIRGCVTTQTERCNENCNRPPPVAHNHP